MLTADFERKFLMNEISCDISATRPGVKLLFEHIDGKNVYYSKFVLFLLLQSFDSVWMAFAFKMLLDSMATQNAALVVGWTWVFLVLGALSSGLAWLAFRFLAESKERLAKNLRTSFLERVLQMPLLVSDGMPKGDLSSRLTVDIIAASDIPNQIYTLARRIFSAVFAAAFMIYLNWQVAIAIAITSPLIVVISGFLSRPVTRLSATLQKAIGDGASQATNLLQGVPVVKSFLAESWAEKCFAHKAESMQAASVKLEKYVALSDAWANSGSFLPFLVAFGYGGFMAVHGKLTIGGMMALVNLCNNLGWPLSEVGKQMSEIKRGLGAFSRVSEVLSQPGEPKALSREKLQLPNTPPDVVVENLSFEYTPGVKALSGVSFRAQAGSLVVIVGKSGCGKSTLLKLLAGLYLPGPGTVFLGGRDLHDTDPRWTRNVTAYVPQEPFLFTGSLKENLKLAQPDASDDEIYSALEEADASRFVYLDPFGLDRELSERGGSLSGGERQRITIARTLLRGGTLLLVDEPTGFLDKQSEKRVWNSLRPVLQTRTCIAATHRLDIAKEADLILVMENGRIAEQGTHETLLAGGTLYPNLVGANQEVAV